MRLYHTFEKSIKDLESNFQNIRTEATALRVEAIHLEGRVSKLEEARSTIAAEVKAAMAEGLGEMRALKAETLAELKVAYVKEAADLYKKDFERQREQERKRLDDTNPQ